MVSAAYGSGGAGGYGQYPPRPPSSNDRKYAQIDQTVGGASQTFRQAMGSTSPKANPNSKQPQQPPPPPQEKGFFDKAKEKFSSIF